jgi:hypothetical protein
MVIAQHARYGFECTKGGYHEKDCFDCLASSHRDGTGLPATKLLVGSSVVRPSGGCRGRGSAPWCRHQRPRVRILWATSCLRLPPARIWLPRSGLWVSFLRTAILSRLRVPWLLRWKGPLWTPAVDQNKPVLSPAPRRCGVLRTNTAEKGDRVRHGPLIDQWQIMGF